MWTLKAVREKFYLLFMHRSARGWRALCESPVIWTSSLTSALNWSGWPLLALLVCMCIRLCCCDISCLLLLCLWMIVYDRWSGSRTSRSTAVDCSENREKLPEQNNELIALAVQSPTELCRGALHEFQP